MSLPLGDLDVQIFLGEYWQQKPCLIKQAFPGFVAELDANDVAGLACDELAESRLISGNFDEKNWMQRHGPFSAKELRRLPDQDWTLLVQDVEKHYPPLQALLAQFRFIPTWRLDDLMISVAATGGSVGPHFDQYDVFLLQASGHRRWQIASKFNPALLADCELNVLEAFEPEQEWDLGPGDMLYLPPGVAHHGVALEPGMTWSIGMRAPSQADLLLALGEWLAESHDEGARYRDTALDGSPRAGEIATGALRSLRQLMAAPMEASTALNGFLARFLTRYRLAHNPEPAKDMVDEHDLSSALTEGSSVQKNPWTRLGWIEESGGARLFAAGEEYACNTAAAILLCTSPLEITDKNSLSPDQLRLLCQLINAGHLYLHDPGS